MKTATTPISQTGSVKKKFVLIKDVGCWNPNFKPHIGIHSVLCHLPNIPQKLF